jgi:hypothetical protein
MITYKSGIGSQPRGRHASSKYFAQAIYIDTTMSRLQTPPVPVLARASVGKCSARTVLGRDHKSIHCKLLAQETQALALHSSEKLHRQPITHVEILPPITKGEA